MKNRVENSGNDSRRRISRGSLVGILVLCLLLIGVVTTLSMQTGQAKKAKAEETTSDRRPKVANPNRRNYVTSNAAGENVVVDRQTGQTRPLTQDEAQRLANGLKQLINQSTDGLVKVEGADGTISMDLRGRFQNVMLAKKDADGNVTESCVDNLETAAAFFEIDPKLLGIAAPVTKAPSGKLEDR